MKLVPEAVLTHHKKSRNLVTLTREGLDDLSSQGFILDFNEDWIAIQSTHDFQLNGLSIFRRKDISSMKSSSTDDFHKKILQSDGLLQKVDFTFRLPASGIDEFLSDLPPNKIVALEDEREDDIYIIGPILEVNDELVTLRYFSPRGTWDTEPGEIRMADITSISLQSPYILAYERHFQREKK